MREKDEHEPCRNVAQEIVTLLIPACHDLLVMVCDPKTPNAALLRCVERILLAVRRARDL